MKAKAIFLSSFEDRPSETFGRVWSEGPRGRLGGLVDLFPEVLRPVDLSRGDLAGWIRETRFVFSTWGMPNLAAEDLARFEALEAVFYAAGTVQGFARPYLARDVAVVSGWAANAIPVAEFTAAQVILALKQALPYTRSLHAQGRAAWGRQHVAGAYGSTVALISLGQIGRRVAGLLKSFDVKIIAYEPYGNPAFANEHGIELVSLEECFSRGDVVSLHAPNLPTTKGMITGALIERMKPYATFINTARNAILDEKSVLDVLEKRRDITAVIDVTDPVEPAAEGSRFYTLPNVFLTPHVAGSCGNEVARLAEYMVDECGRWLRGEPLLYRVSEAMLDTMA